MIKSKAWEWEKVTKDDENYWYNENYWKEPCMESYYMLNRWLAQNKTDFLDLGCGLGRHTIQFAKAGFNTFAFDLSEKSIQTTKEWAEREKLKVDFKNGDMINLPYENGTMDCILCNGVISHTDTEGAKQVVDEIYRVLKKEGECYLTLGSKATWGFQQDCPIVDENTKLKMEEGPEKGVQHFYADTDLIFKLFSTFKIVTLNHIEYITRENVSSQSHWCYHMLIRK